MADAEQVQEQVRGPAPDRADATSRDGRAQKGEKREKWLSSKIEVSLMDELDEKARSIGLSRSGAVRKAVTQWVEKPLADTNHVASVESERDEGGEDSAAADAQISRIPQRLDRIEDTLAALQQLMARLEPSPSGEVQEDREDRESEDGQTEEPEDSTGPTQTTEPTDVADARGSGENAEDSSIDSTDNATEDPQNSLTSLTSLANMQMHEGEDLLDWIEQQSNESHESHESEH